MKKVLILGGTRFIGRRLVERLAADEKYFLTLFNRLQTGGDLFPNIQKIKGDRETDDIYQIASENWDYVIDLSCYYPSALAAVVENLNSSPEKYIFISTCSVYDNARHQGILRTEEAPILDCSAEQAINSSTDSYGNRKAECERILKRSDLPYVIFRPALVYGTFDPTDRLYYWLYQVMINDPILLPDSGDRSFSMTYVDDLVEAIILSLESPFSNEVFNAVSTPRGSIRQIVDGARDLLGIDPKELNASPEFLKSRGISEWTDMPLWLDTDDFTYDNSKLMDLLGIKPTDFRKSIEQTIEYYEKLEWPMPGYGMSEEKRRSLIASLSSDDMTV